MDLPKLVYEDFYKFLMSSGIILFLVSLGLGIYITDKPPLKYQSTFLIIDIVIFVFSIFLIIYAGLKWRKNQIFLDERYEFDNETLKAQRDLFRAKAEFIKQNIQTQGGEEPKREIVTGTPQTITGEKIQKETNTAKVFYSIASFFPNTIPFKFLNDWKVWFKIQNHDEKKYNAYIKITFIMSDGYEKDAGGHYGGDVAWRLNALSGFIAPGLGIPEEVKERVKRGINIKIRILCKIKDESNNLIEEKLPVEYIYDPQKDNWYSEP